MAERIPFSRVDPDGSTFDGTARIDRGPDGMPVVISDLRDLDGAALALPDGSIFAVGGDGQED